MTRARPHSDREAARTLQREPNAQAAAPVGMSRRDFGRTAAVLAALTIEGRAVASSSAPGARLDESRMAVLVDLTRCVGCRRCEWACADANENPHGSLESYDDQSVFMSMRQPTQSQHCVVNRAASKPGESGPLHLKIQCMQCEKPACVSACLVGAMRKDPEGPVTYDASRCIGCRYCLVACPFGRLAYEYDRSLTPRVRKCEMCRHRTAEGRLPACVEICPVEALQYGRRDDLLSIAHDRIAAHPQKYVDHVYGESEAGGTSWLYLSPRPFEELSDAGFPSLGPRSPAERTESIQHGIFKWGAAPALLAALLATLNKVTRKGAST